MDSTLTSKLRALFILLAAVVGLALVLVHPAWRAPQHVLSATYQLASGTVRVEYFDDHAFRLYSTTGHDALVVNGKLYAVKGDQPYFVDAFRRRNVTTSSEGVPVIRATTSTSAEVARDDGLRLYSAEVLRYGGLSRLSFLLARDNAFANAQHAMHRMLSAMDLSRFGDDIRTLVALWLPELTREGYAILESGDRLRLSAPLTRLPISFRPTLASVNPTVATSRNTPRS
jgi:hypothetical protein